MGIMRNKRTTLKTETVRPAVAAARQSDPGGRSGATSSVSPFVTEISQIAGVKESRHSDQGGRFLMGA